MRIYVGNLSYNTQNADLEKAFVVYGDVASATVAVDRDTNRSKGFGFVEMVDDTQAQNAIAGLNDKDLDGRKLTVNQAKPREARPFNSNQSRNSYQPRNIGQPRNDNQQAANYQKGHVQQKGDAHQQRRDHRKSRDYQEDNPRRW
jgi:RNA recognition motif-containing protein